MTRDRRAPTIVDSYERADDVSAFLGRKLYEFNVGASGIADGKLMSFSAVDDAGTLVAGLAGYTWGGCGFVRELWVDEAERGRGLGGALLKAAEDEAVRRGCHRMILSTHSFQAPGFYRRLGYEEVTRIEDFPPGHASIYFARSLPGRPPVA